MGTSFIIENLMRIRVTSVDVDDVAPPIVKLSDAKRHASLLSSFLSRNSLCVDVYEIIGFQNLGGNLDKMTIANLGRQHKISYFKSFENICICLELEVIRLYNLYCLKLVVYILMCSYSLNNTTTLCHLSY